MVQTHCNLLKSFLFNYVTSLVLLGIGRDIIFDHRFFIISDRSSVTGWSRQLLEEVEWGHPDCSQRWWAHPMNLGSQIVSSCTSFADIMIHLLETIILVIPLWIRWFFSKHSADLQGILGDAESRGEDGCCLRVTGGAKQKFWERWEENEMKTVNLCCPKKKVKTKQITGLQQTVQRCFFWDKFLF